MDLTSTSSLILFPMTPAPMSGSNRGSEDFQLQRGQYYEIARQASWQLPPVPQLHYYSPPPQVQQHKQHHEQPQQQRGRQQQPQCKLPSARLAAMHSESSAQSQAQASYARRRQEREELKRIQITSFRKDGLLSPPPLPVYVRRKKKSVSNISINPRAMESTPDLASGSSSDNDDDESDHYSPASPSTPTSYFSSRKYAASVTDLSVYTSDPALGSRSGGFGLGITSPGPRSAPALRGYNISPTAKRPSPFRSRTLDEAFLGASMIQPPTPSLLRPKSFWKNHPRSALTSLAYSPCSQVVRRSTFVAAGMNIDQGFWEQTTENDPPAFPDHPPRPPPKDDAQDQDPDSPDSDSEPDLHRNEGQYDAIRAFGKSLWNASTLALAVESRNRGGIGGISGMPGIVCVPGEF